MPLSTQEYKWVPANCWGKPNKLLGSDLRWTSIRPGGVEILLGASCYGNRDKLRPDEPGGSKGFTSLTIHDSMKRGQIKSSWPQKAYKRVISFSLSHDKPSGKLQPRTKLLRHFNAIFNVAPRNHRVQKEQTRPPPHPWCNVASAEQLKHAFLVLPQTTLQWGRGKTIF